MADNNTSAGTQYKLSDRQIKTLLSDKMDWTTWWDSPFKYFNNFSGISATDYAKIEMESVSPAGSDGVNRPQSVDVISTYVNFQREGGVEMDVPVRYPLTGKPKIGDEQLIGSGEQRKIAYKKVAICPVRKSVTIQTGFYSAEMLKKPEIKLELLQSGAADLGDYFNRYVNYNWYLSILQGVSHNLTRQGDGTPNYVRWSHPNIMLANVGLVTDVNSGVKPRTDAFESDLLGRINALGTATAVTFSTKTIRNMVLIAARKRVPKFKFGNKQGYLLIIHQAQLAQLQADSEYKAANQSIADINPTLTGIVEGYYQGCYIMVGADVPSIKTSSTKGTGEFLSRSDSECMLTGTSALGDAAIQYGVSTFMDDPTDSGVYKCAMLLGRSAIAAGYGDKLTFDSEAWDFTAKKEDGARMTYGAMRTDVLDSDNFFAGGLKENNSSVVCVTYSPDTLSW